MIRRAIAFHDDQPPSNQPPQAFARHASPSPGKTGDALPGETHTRVSQPAARRHPLTNMDGDHVNDYQPAEPRDLMLTIVAWAVAFVLLVGAAERRMYNSHSDWTGDRRSALDAREAAATCGLLMLAVALPPMTQGAWP